MKVIIRSKLYTYVVVFSIFYGSIDYRPERSSDLIFILFLCVNIFKLPVVKNFETEFHFDCE